MTRQPSPRRHDLDQCHYLITQARRYRHVSRLSAQYLNQASAHRKAIQ